MKNNLFVTILILSFLLISFSLWADWNEGDGHKMHFPQLPDLDGLDVRATHPKVLADDWECSETGWIWDIHFWGSWKNDMVGTIEKFHLSVHSNDPGGDHSQPADTLWEHDFFEWQEREYATGLQGWYDPNSGEYISDNHNMIFQYNFFLPIDLRIPQTQGEIYWLDVTAHTTEDDSLNDRFWGWKTADVFVYPEPYTGSHFMDDAVWGDFPDPVWNELVYPPGHPRQGESIDLAFVINGDATLPVELSTFNAIYSNNAAHLSWVTQTEQDNIGWNIYRNNQSEFSSATQINQQLIEGHGTTTEPSYYNYSDGSHELTIGTTYYYWLESMDLSGQSHVYNSLVSITVPDPAIQPPDYEKPVVYSLNAAPNPMLNQTNFNFTLDRDAMVNISIYNLKGKLIKKLPAVAANSDEKMRVYWNGKDRYGAELSSGVYLYKLEANGKPIQSQKLLIIR